MVATKGAIKMGQGVVIENFHHFLNGNQIFSTATKKGLSYVFGKLSSKAFQKHVALPTSLTT
jgi:hypothetical protein